MFFVMNVPVKSKAGCLLGGAVPLQGREEIQLTWQVGFGGTRRSLPSLGKKLIKAYTRKGLWLVFRQRAGGLASPLGKTQTRGGAKLDFTRK